MPRPKSYDRNEAIAKACLAFLQHGYQALGVRELEEIVGINQFAIRSEFGGKEGLFLEALNYYSETAIQNEMGAMRDGGIAEICAFFRGLVTPGSNTSSDFGCLIVNTGIENARIKSPRLAKAVSAYWAALEDHFRTVLENENAWGSSIEARDPVASAKALVSAVMGIHARNRAMMDQTAGAELVALICDMLAGTWAPETKSGLPR